MSTDLVGSYLGPYRITEIISRGGMAILYKAYQESLDRDVAIKVLRHDNDPQFVSRFKREARAVAAIQHHNIIPVYDYGEQGGELFLVFQYVKDGLTLGNMLGRPLAPQTALRLMCKVLDALEYAHIRGIVHRDIKPTNVLMPTPTWPMLADFGIAKLMYASQRLTQSGMILGTPVYMAPEQASGGPIDARTDLYSAGVVLYEMVTGQVPFQADTPRELWAKHVYEAPPEPRRLNPDLPAIVEQAVLRALAKAPAARYQSAAEMAGDLERIARQVEDHHVLDTQARELYQEGVTAFEAGQWAETIERFNLLATLDPSYQDAPELLAAARECQERAQAEAQRQLELVRWRQGKIHQQASTAAPSLPNSSSASLASVQQADALAPPEQVESMVARAAPARQHKLSDLPVDAPASAPDLSAAPPLSGARQGQAWRRSAPWLLAMLLIAAAASVIAREASGGKLTPRPTTGPASATVVAGAASATNVVAASPTGTSGTASATVESIPAPAGKLAFEDDFHAQPDPSGLEDNLAAPDFSRGIHAPGVYHIKLLKPNDMHWVVLPRRAYSNFTMQLDLYDNSDGFEGDTSQGVVFRVRDDAHLYAVLVDPRKGQYAIRKLDGKDNWSDLTSWKDSPLVKRQDAINQLRVDATDDQFTIYLNGGLLDRFRDQTNQFGMLGMIGANVDAIMPHLHFDNLKVWSSNPLLRAPQPPTERQTTVGDMILVSGGAFIMGGNESSDMQPPHIIDLPDFYIDRTEVTNGAYLQCVDVGGCSPPNPLDSATRANYASQPEFSAFPVINVSWEQARRFCAWAGKRLPTEAEWEKAASWNAATSEKFTWPWGDQFDQTRLNSAESHNNDTTAVRQFLEELNHTFDMAGNVSEWTNSLSKPYPYNAVDGREAYPAPGERIFRGGSWAKTQDKNQNSLRQAAPPGYTSPRLGFRCAANP